MKTITLAMDNESCRIYEDFSPDCQQKFAREVSIMLQNIAHDARATKLKKMIQDINNESDCSYLNADVLLELLPID